MKALWLTLIKCINDRNNFRLTFFLYIFYREPFSSVLDYYCVTDNKPTCDRGPLPATCVGIFELVRCLNVFHRREFFIPQRLYQFFTQSAFDPVTYIIDRW